MVAARKDESESVEDKVKEDIKFKSLTEVERETQQEQIIKIQSIWKTMTVINKSLYIWGTK